MTDTLEALLYTCSRTPEDRLALLVCADRAQEEDESSLERLLRHMAARKAVFLFTGSRRYGTPRPDSDFDWVVRWPVLCPAATFLEWKEIVAAGGPSKEYAYDGDTKLSLAFRCGPVNVLVVRSDRQWRIWQDGTELLAARALRKGPRTKDEAILTFDTITAFRNEEDMIYEMYE